MSNAVLRLLRNVTRSTSALVDTVLSDPCSTVPLTVTPLTDRPGGARVVSSPVSGLVVGIAPVNQTGMLTDLPSFAGGGGYACLSHGTLEVPDLQLRPGETLDLPRRLAEHLAVPPCAVEHVLLVGPADPVFSSLGRDGSLAIQWLLHRAAERSGRTVLHGARPQSPALLARRPEVLRRWAADLVPMLTACGTHGFVPLGSVIGPVEEDEVEFRAVKTGYETALPPGLTERAGARLYELAWERVSALATVVGSWTVLHAGSTVDPVDRSGIQGCIAAKRMHMLEHGVLQRLPSGLLRFTCDTAVPSLVNAIRIVTGTNEREHHWRFYA